MESKWAMFKTSIVEAAARSYDQKVCLCLSWWLMVDPSGEGSSEAEGGFSGLVGPGVS